VRTFGLLLLAAGFALPPAEAGFDADSAAAYCRSHAAAPLDYVIGRFAQSDVVLLAEDHAVAQNLALARDLLPALYKAGVYTFGMEFGASEDQARLDALVTGERYDEGEARRLMFDYNVRWAYRDYTELYRAAWRLNQTLPPSARKFRILNLSYRYAWSAFGGLRSPSSVARVFPKGDTESYRATLVRDEILGKHEKILVLTGTIHAFTRYERPDYDYLSPGFYRLETRYFGERLQRLAPGRVCCLLLHQPFPDSEGGFVQPAGGALEAIMAKLGDRPVGFDLAGTPMGDLPDASYYANGHPDFRLADLADGYVFLAPLRQLQGAEVDDHFLEGGSWPQAQREWPDSDWTPRPASPEQYWRIVRRFADLADRYGNVRSESAPARGEPPARVPALPSPSRAAPKDS
jgi:hypothetical protein